MGLLDKLKQLFGGDGKGADETKASSKRASGSAPVGDPNGIILYFKCSKCSAPVRVRVDRRSDLNPEDGPGTYIVRKDVMDSKCFQIMKAEIWLDSSYNVVETDIRGGTLISEEEFKALQPAK
ncbi:MAG: hypothetical protein GXY52_08880 [Chloroflexi bacterium]|nr:hypothetical protein [Chloroflexota bacterium]